MQQLLPVHTIITNIKGSVSITKGTVLVNDELFTQAEEHIKAKYENLIIVDEKEFAKERANLRKFAKTLKDFYKTLESELLADLRKNVYDKINNLSSVAEQLANDIADKESVFIIEKQEHALSKVLDYIDSLTGAPYFTDKEQIEIKPFYKNYSNGAFLRAKKDVDDQLKQLEQDYARNILEQQQQAVESQQEAKNYEYLVNHINTLNAKYKLNINASQFYELRKLHLSDALQEIDKYAEFLRLNNPIELDNKDSDNNTDMDVLALLKQAQYILHTEHGLTLEPLEKAIEILKKTS